MALYKTEIREQPEGDYEGVASYRSFKALLDKNVMYGVLVDKQPVENVSGNFETSKSGHTHFYCEEFENVEGLDMVPVNLPEFQEDFFVNETEQIIRVSCNICRAKNG